MMQGVEHVRFLPLGDAALAVEFGDAIDRATSARVLRLAGEVAALEEGVVELVPTFRSLLVQYDPLQGSAARIEAAIRARLDDATAPTESPARLWRLPACYEPAFAPDLADVARRADLAEAEVARLHAETTFHVYLVGFAPGFPYMGDVPPALRFPRRAEPRIRVPAGSVAIATAMTGVYPVESPGGWHLIAHCPVRLFDPLAAEPSLLAPGDAVRFEPVAGPEHARIAAAVARGGYQPPCEEITS